MRAGKAKLAGLLLAWLATVLTACTTAPPPPPPDPAFAALQLRSVAVGPVAYATRQPDEPCSLYADEDLRSAVARELRRRGYVAFSVGNSVPRSFAAGSPSPPPDAPPSIDKTPPEGADGLMAVWIEDYQEHNPCGDWFGPQYLTMEAVAILYAGVPPVEVWRGRGRAAEQGTYAARDLFWLTTSRLTDQLLDSLPAGPEWPAGH